MFPCGVVRLLGVAFGLDHGFFVGTFCEVFGLSLDVLYNMRVSGERGMVRPYNGFDDLIHGLQALRIDPCYNFFLTFANLDVEDCGACHIDRLVGISELCLPVVVGDRKVIDLEASKALVPL